MVYVYVYNIIHYICILDLLIVIRRDRLDISLVLSHVLLHLQVQIRHECPVLLVGDVVGDHEEEHTSSHQGEAKDQYLFSLGSLGDEGVLGEAEDPDDTEEDAQYVEENPDFAWLGPVLRITPGWSAVDAGGGGGLT